MKGTLFSFAFGIIFCISSVFSNPNYYRGIRQTEDEELQAAEEIVSSLQDDPQQSDFKEEPLGLPSNSSSIRSNIVDTFSCSGKPYGYYADVENECQIFHVCLPASFPDGTEKMFKWSFICPHETIFNQESFTCTRAEDSVPCQDAPTFYSLNDNFGRIPEKEV